MLEINYKATMGSFNKANYQAQYAIDPFFHTMPRFHYLLLWKLLKKSITISLLVYIV